MFNIHTVVLELLPDDCKICSLKWIKHDGSLGTSVQPINVEDKYFFTKGNHTPVMFITLACVTKVGSASAPFSTTDISSCMTKLCIGDVEGFAQHANYNCFMYGLSTSKY